MAHTFTDSGLQFPSLHKTFTFDDLTKNYNFSAIAYTVFTSFISVLLICIALRAVCALFVVNNGFTHFLTGLTTPFILPFSRIIPDENAMIQFSAGTAFTGYFVLYWLVAAFYHYAHKSEPVSDNTSLSTL